MRRRRIALGFVLLAGLPAYGGQAQAAPDPSPSPGFAEQVVVTATRIERSSMELPLSTTVLTRSDVESTPALLSDDLLRGVPAVDLPTGSSQTLFPSSVTVSMRGLAGSRALVMLDGVPLNDAFFGYVQWNQVPVQGVESVEVVRGGGASLFGNYSMGGTIQLLTPAASRRRGSLDVLGGGHGTFRVRGAGSRPIGPSAKNGLSLDADYLATDGSILTVPEDRSRLDIPRDAEQLNLRLKLEHGDDSGRHASVRLAWSDDNQSLGTPLSGFTRDLLNVAGSGRVPAARGNLRGSLFFQDQTFDVDNTSTLGAGAALSEFVVNTNHTPIRDLGGFLQWDREWGGSFRSATFGADFRRVEGNNLATSFASTGSVTGTLDSGGRQNFLGLFAETSVRPSPRVELLIGARVDRFDNVEGREIASPGATTRFTDVSSTEWNPRLAARFSVNDVVTLRGAGYRSFRAPTLNELYRTFFTKSLAVFSNSALGPETSRGGDFGVELRGRRANGQLNVFLNDVDDLVSRGFVANGPRPVSFRLTNLGAIRSRGIEAFGRSALGSRFRVDASYTLTDSTITSNPSDRSIEGNRVPSVPRHRVSASLGYQGSRFKTTLRGRSLSRQFVDTANRTEQDAHVVADLFASFDLRPRIQLYLVGENIFDEVYLAEVGAARRMGAPRQFSAGIRLNVAGDR